MKEAFLSLHLGRPLLGQRVGDLLAVIAAMADESPGGISLVGHGTAGPIALHAAALEPRIVALSLDGAITSWSDVVRTPLTRDQLARASSRGRSRPTTCPTWPPRSPPGRYTIRSAADASGRPMAPERVDAAYAVARKAYRERGVRKRR